MALEARIRELGTRHESLELEIRNERRRPGGDDLRLQELKRQKLKLKEEMDALSRKLN